MQAEILFTERQRFRQWWLWLLMLGTNSMFIYGIFVQVVGGEPFGDKPMSDTGLIAATVLNLLFTSLLLVIHLKTQITSQGIDIRYFPFHFRYKHYAWDSIQSVTVREYAPIKEYGGWGLRGYGKNKAYTVSGKYGLQIELRDGRKLLIGTQERDELRAAMGHILLTGSAKDTARGNDQRPGN